MTWQRSLQAAIRSLRQEEQRLARQLDSVRERIGHLQGLGSNGRRKGARGGRGRLSAKGREAIARAARKRWAAYRAQKQKAAR